SRWGAAGGPASSGPGLTVAPSSAAGGTTFTFTASGFTPAETLRFEITGPEGKPYVGPAHTVPANGMVTATYRATAPAGTYAVKADGAKGDSAASGFSL